MEPYIFTSVEESDDDVESLARGLATPVFRGSLENKVDRWYQGFEFFGLEDGHLVDVDDPFFDPVRCKSSLDQLRSTEGCELVLPSERSDSGEAYVGTSIGRNALRNARLTLRALGIENTDVVPWSLLVPELNTARSDDEVGPARFRLTLDYPEDYELLTLLANQFGPTTRRKELESFLSDHGELTAINYFRNEEFLDNKASHLRKIGVDNA